MRCLYHYLNSLARQPRSMYTVEVATHAHLACITTTQTPVSSSYTHEENTHSHLVASPPYLRDEWKTAQTEA